MDGATVICYDKFMNWKLVGALVIINVAIMIKLGLLLADTIAHYFFSTAQVLNY